jgi:hypothetical protein
MNTRPIALAAVFVASLFTTGKVLANVYTYDVDWTIGAQTLSGTIETNCNNCNLLPCNIVSWSFASTDGFNLNSTEPNTFVQSICRRLSSN